MGDFWRGNGVDLSRVRPDYPPARVGGAALGGLILSQL